LHQVDQLLLSGTQGGIGGAAQGRPAFGRKLRGGAEGIDGKKATMINQRLTGLGELCGNLGDGVI
jgi:hypothetical protein